MSEVLTDQSRLWFGKHKGKKLKDVPATYLIWCSEKFKEEGQFLKLHEYINTNWESIQMDAEMEYHHG